MQKDNLITTVIGISVFFLLLVIAIFLIFRVSVRKKNKLLLEKKMMSIQFEQTLLESKLALQEQIFADISQELHDNICQVLSLIRLGLNTLNAPGESERLVHMDVLLEKGLADLRQLSHSLDADQIRSTGWISPATKLINSLQGTGKFTATAELDNNLLPIGSERGIILFRMIQEVVNNIVKHAEAKAIVLKAKNENDKLVISIRDNGKGFDNNLISEGAGLRNLEKRSKMIDAGLVITSKPGDGTCVTITINTEKIG